MLTYAKLALIALQVVQAILRAAGERRTFDAGQDRQIAEQAKAVLGMTAEGKRLLEKIDAMGDGDLDDLADAVGRAGR